MEPSEQEQADWGAFGKITIGKAIRALWAFVMVPSWSRQIFLRFYLSAAMPNFVRGHTDAFAFFLGIPRVLLYDNLGVEGASHVSWLMVEHGCFHVLSSYGGAVGHTHDSYTS